MRKKSENEMGTGLIVVYNYITVIYWVAVKGLNFRYYIRETIFVIFLPMT